MKKLTIILLCGLSVAMTGCKKKEEPPPPEEDPSVIENIKEAASDFKETADGTARKVGGTAKKFGSKVGNAFRSAKEELFD